jgi:hypothetical protein
MAPLREDGWRPRAGKGILHRLRLTRELRIELHQLIILRCQSSRLLEELLARLAKIGNLALESLALGRQRLELLAILFADRVETARQRVAKIGGGVGLGDALNSFRVDAATR